MTQPEKTCPQCQRPHRYATLRCQPCQRRKECPQCGRTHTRCTRLCGKCRRAAAAPVRNCAACAAAFTASATRTLCKACRSPRCSSCGCTVSYSSYRRTAGRPRRCQSCLFDSAGVIVPTRPPEPTAVRPGPAKVIELCRRYAAGMFLWHKDDAKLDAD